ncbi:MAG: cyclic nucleotide-binding domain-containing protein [Rhodoferax sp.]
MNSLRPSFAKFQVQDLNAAIAQNQNYDALPLTLSASEWAPLIGYLQPFTLAQDQVLIEQDAMDRTLYFVESGTVSVHREDGDGAMTLALVGAGSVLGEGSFFSSLSRKASAIGSSPCRLWSLTVNRFLELATRQPALALRVTLALGAVLAKRVENSPRRAAVV